MATRKSPRKKKTSSTRKYSRKSGEEVRKEMQHMRSSKHPVKGRKQAIASALSKAGKKRAKAPPRKSSSRRKAA